MSNFQIQMSLLGLLDFSGEIALTILDGLGYTEVSWGMDFVLSVLPLYLHFPQLSLSS